MAKLLGCPTCGHDVAEGAPQCMNCGQQGPFVYTPPPPPSAETLRQKERQREIDRKIITISIVVIIISLLGSLVLYLLMS